MEALTNLEMLMVLCFVVMVTCMAVLVIVIAAAIAGDTAPDLDFWREDKKQWYMNLCIASSFATCALLALGSVWYAAYNLGALSWIIN